MTDIELTVRCKPFSAQGRGDYRVLVDLEEGLVRVANELEPGTYTLVHSLSAATQRKILAQARAAASEGA